MVEVSETQSDCDLNRAELDVQIRHLEHQLATLIARRNATASISRLPDDILGQIILEYVSGLSGHPWYPIMLVCRKWRSIGLSYSRLWSFVMDVRDCPTWYSHEFTQLWIERSGQHPLNCLFRWEDTGIEVRSFFRDHAARVQELVMIGSGSRLETSFNDRQQFPLLESLGLESHPAMHTPFPDFLLEGAAPRLHTIKLKDINIRRWDLLSNLTELNLVQSPAPSASISVRQLLSCLQRSPHLHALVLRHPVSEDASTLRAILRDPSCPSISLPQLDILHVAYSYQAMNVLLRILTLPPTTTLSLHPVGAGCGSEISAMLVPVRLHFHRPGAPVLRSLKIVARPYHQTVIVAHTNLPTNYADAHIHADADADANGQISPLFFVISHHDLADRHALRRLLAKILAALPLNDVANLDATNMRPAWYSPATWRTIFSRMPRLQLVQVGVNETMVMMFAGLLNALRRGSRGLCGKARRRAAKAPRSWPSHLRLHSLAGNEILGPRDPDTSGAELLKYGSDLVHMLEMYKNMDAPHKPAGALWKTLEVCNEDFASFPFGFDCGYEICPLVHELRFDGMTWHKKAEGAVRAEEVNSIGTGQPVVDYGGLVDREEGEIPEDGTWT